MEKEEYISFAIFHNLTIFETSALSGDECLNACDVVEFTFYDVCMYSMYVHVYMLTNYYSILLCKFKIF